MNLASSSYDVLINFTGEEIRRKFVSHLDSSLSSAGFTTFLHEENVVKQIQLQEQLTQAKEMCRVAIVVFTKTYAESAWCLHELQQIIKWHETYCRHVLPVYYEIQPSDVQGDFGKALKATAQQTFSPQQVEPALFRWRRALTKAANFFGWDESNYRSDAELVDKIVKRVLYLPALSATKYPVGLQSRVKYLIRVIENKSPEVFVIGIYGMGGSGKTTIAKAIYHQMHGKFMEKSFIEDVSQVSKTRGHAHLQGQLLSDVLKIKVDLHTVEMGKSMIQERLSGKKMLIVLDDVDESYSLDCLCGSREWFGQGTVIIITSRYEHLLGMHRLDSFLQIKPMDASESLELLSWHAFREAKPKEEYNELARRLVIHCRGLPLILEVIGSYLFERTKEEWETVLLKLMETPSNKFQEILELSLHDDNEKDMFLDVCCFFIGKDRGYVTEVLNSCELHADIGIAVLIERGLLKVEKNNKLGMHHLLRDMGREIISGSSKTEREKRHRLSSADDLKFVVTKNTGTEAFQGLVLKSPLTDTTWSEYFSFREMSTVKLSVLKYVEFPGDHPNFFKQLRWICHRGFPLEYIPENCDMESVIAIDLKWSNLRRVWKQPRVLGWLKFLNLSHSKYLTETPDFSGLPSLEKLILKDCPRLCKVHQSIGDLCNLLLINLKDCTNLSNLPKDLYKLKSLKVLILSGCSKIHILEEDIVQMKSLMTLISENKAAKQVPFSIVCSRCVGYVSLRGFEGLSHNTFPSIIRSWMSPTMNLLSYYIRHYCMNMENNNWCDLAPLFSSLANLRSVLVQCDTEFQLSKQVKIILVEYGVNFTESRISEHQLRFSLIGVGSYNVFFNTLNDSISQGLASSESCEVSLPGDNHPYWLAHIGVGHSVYFTVPQDCDMKGMALCVVYLSTPEIIAPECLRSVLIVNYTKCTLQIHKHGTVISFNDIDWQGIISNLGSGDKVEIFVTFGNGLVVKNTAVYLIYNESKKNTLNKFIKKIVMRA